MLVPNSKISDYVTKKILHCFCVDLTATQTAKLLELNRKTINRIYLHCRHVIYQFQVKETACIIHGQCEVDESYFWARRVRGKRGRWALWKTIVFGIYERRGAIYTEIVPDASKPTLQKTIRGHIAYDSQIFSDFRASYSWLVDVGYDKHYRVKHSANQFSNKKGNHINGIEAYRSFCKRRLAKFNGVKMNFEYHLKECERRYGKSYKQLYTHLISLLRSSN